MLTHSNNLAGTSRLFKRLAREQTPFATSVAINETANQAKKALEVQLPRYIDRPTPFTMRAFAIKRSTKKKLQAFLTVKPLQEDYLQYAIYGGVRFPRSRAVLVPASTRLNQYGNMPRRAIRTLLAKKNVFSGEVNGVAGIWERRKKGGLKLLVAYAAKASYRARFPLHKIVNGVVKHRLQKNFDVALEKAIKTARKK